MSDQENILKDDQLGNYDFGSQSAPEGFDPESKGWQAPPPGMYVMRLESFEVKAGHVFNSKDVGQWIGNQIRPRLVVASGPHAGSSLTDFLPLPTKNSPMPKSLANRWANFLRAFGYSWPATSLIPPNFKLHDLKTRTCGAEVVVEEYDNKLRSKVKFFGYCTVEESKNWTPSAAAQAGNGNGNGHAAKTAASAPVAAGVEATFDDL